MLPSFGRTVRINKNMKEFDDLDPSHKCIGPCSNRVAIISSKKFVNYSGIFQRLSRLKQSYKLP